MAHTNQTANYELPQFIGSDKPAWLVDFNQAMSAIDTAMKSNQTAAGTAATAAAQAQTSADTANSAATAAGATAQSALLTANQTAADLLSVQNRVAELEGQSVGVGDSSVVLAVQAGTRTFTAERSGLGLLINSPTDTSGSGTYIKDTTANQDVGAAFLPQGYNAIAYTVFPMIAGHVYQVRGSGTGRAGVSIYPLILV